MGIGSSVLFSHHREEKLTENCDNGNRFKCNIHTSQGRET
jgi:hypothetical protein